MLSLLSVAVAAISLSIGPRVMPPDVNLSAIRPIVCSDGSYGTGFVIEGDIMVTARHVAAGVDGELLSCMDYITKTPLKTYHDDKDHDIALMKPMGPLFVYYPLKYDCKPYAKGTVNLYGHRPESFRQNNLTATGKYINMRVGGMPPVSGLHILVGEGAQGMSGGPGIQDGYVRGMVNVGEWNMFGYPIKVMSTELRNTILCRH